MYPKVIFVEGPHAVGKDYFIDNLKREISLKYPDKRVNVVRAADYMTPFVKNNRSYSSSEEQQYQIEKLFNCHLHLLESVRNFLICDKYDIVLVNRSFLSFLIFNLNTECNNNTKELNDKMRGDKNKYIDAYVDIFKDGFCDIETHHVTLTSVIGTEEEKLNNILERIKERNDGNIINIDYLKYLINSYSEIDSKLLEVFTYTQETTSGEYLNFLKDHIS